MLTRNKRIGINFLTRNWPETVLALNGVKLNVLGEENLTAQRPAVFLFNHRNNFDIFIVAALVKDNWTGIAKKELETNPLVGPLGKLMDAAFIDRADTASAVAALAPIEEAARKGLSIVVAPEGTRLDTQSVGPFKKGAFRIAMATGLPVVPIVIRNSDSVAGRNSTTLNPGTVDVAVLPPVSTADWTVQDLRERIEEVRIAYVELLAEWPAARGRRCERRRTRSRTWPGCWPTGPGTVVLTQASTPTEARLIRGADRGGGRDRTTACRRSAWDRPAKGCRRRCWTATRTSGWCRCGWPGCPRSTRAGARPGWPTCCRATTRTIPANGSSSGSWPASRAGPWCWSASPPRVGSLRQRWAETTDGDDFALPTWPGGPRWRWTGPSTGCAGPGTRRRAWSGTRSCPRAGSGPGCAGVRRGR